jgi:hypothetical protein
VVLLEPEQEPQPPQHDQFMFNGWRDNLPSGEEYSSDESALESEDDPVDQCPEPDNPIEEIDVPLPRHDLIRPITPEDPAEQPPRAMAQIVEDREFRPAPNEHEEFECKRYFPHERNDELFESGDPDTSRSTLSKRAKGCESSWKKTCSSSCTRRWLRRSKLSSRKRFSPTSFCQNSTGSKNATAPRARKMYRE